MFSGLETRCFISNSKNQQASILLSIQKHKTRIKPKFISVYIGLDGVEMTILNTEIIL
jgi:hypothetical protein